MATTCPRCRAQLPDQAQFCTQCGYRFSITQSGEAVPQQAPETRINPDPMNSPSMAGMNAPSHAGGMNAPSQPGGMNAPSHAGGMNAPSHAGGMNAPSHAGMHSPSPAAGMNAPSGAMHAPSGGAPRTMAIAQFTPGAAAAGPSEVTIGRQPANTIVVDSADVSGWHARIMRNPNGGGLLIEDVGSTNGTYVNGQRINISPITFRDDVRVASVLVQLSDPRIAGMLVRVNKRPQRGQPITLGSAPSCDVVLDAPNVAPQHATLTETPDGFLIVKDLGTQQGTYIDGPNFRVDEARVHGSNTLLFGDFPLPLALLGRLLDEAEGAGRSSLVLADALGKAMLDRQVLTVGREQGNDLVLPHPTISTRHARFSRRQDGTVLVEDFGSTNGTYINGERIKSAVAKPGDAVAVGAITLLIGQGGVIEGAERAKVRLDLVQIGFTVKDRSTGQPRALLDSITMSIFPNELVGMLGPSGAGKTTLLMTVLGLNRPTGGGVLLNGRPLFQQYESFRTNVGYVPQDDIVHPELTVTEALFYACKLRLPAGTKNAQINAAIEETLKQVGLWEQKGLQIGSAEHKILSGGQRRRVNLAVELVTDPSLLILDEPTSGLSWTDAADVVATLRKLANDGRTVVLTIHQPDYQEYEKFDTVAIMGKGGKLLFYGPPDPDSYEFFGAERNKPRQMFDHVEQMPPDAWREKFHQTETHRRFVVERAPKADAANQSPPPKPRSRSSVRQFPVLLARSMKLTWRNKTALLVLMLQAPILGFLIGITIGNGMDYQQPMFGCIDTSEAGDWCVDDLRLSCDPQQRIAAIQTMPAHPHVDARIPDPRTGLIAILMALFLPMVIASSNVLVGERTIYERERLAGLNILPYVLARFIVLVVLGVIVAALNMLVAVPMLGLEGGLHWYLLVGIMTTSTSAAMGLALSAAVKRPTSALWGINMLVIPQLLFAGGIVKLEGITRIVSWATATRYGLEALTNIDLYARNELDTCQVTRYMYNFAGFRTSLDYPMLQAAGGMAAITLVSLVLTMLLLRLKDKN